MKTLCKYLLSATAWWSLTVLALGSIGFFVSYGWHLAASLFAQ